MRNTRFVIAAALLACVAVSGSPAQDRINTRLDQPPRKVIVGTAMKALWGNHPGLENRLQLLTGLVDRMAEESQKKYGRGLDLAILPETAVSGELSDDVAARSVPLAGPLKEAFARKARERHTYIVVPTYLLEGPQKWSNAAILFGRDGEVVGIYRKVHLAVHTNSDSLENGTMPGKEVPVFECDFGRLGIQICFDMEFDYGWDQLARKGADLVAWPTQSPQTVQPASRAQAYGYYIVSSTWRHNASVFEPTGKIVSQIKLPEETMVQELDLSYVILPWSPDLNNGKALSRKYGDKVGYRYYEDEDNGIFWSNDPKVPVGSMMRSLNLAPAERELERIRKLFKAAGVPGN